MDDHDYDDDIYEYEEHVYDDDQDSESETDSDMDDAEHESLRLTSGLSPSEYRELCKEVDSPNFEAMYSLKLNQSKLMKTMAQEDPRMATKKLKKFRKEIIIPAITIARKLTAGQDDESKKLLIIMSLCTYLVIPLDPWLLARIFRMIIAGIISEDAWGIIEDYHYCDLNFNDNEFSSNIARLCDEKYSANHDIVRTFLYTFIRYGTVFGVTPEDVLNPMKQYLPQLQRYEEKFKHILTITDYVSNIARSYGFTPSNNAIYRPLWFVPFAKDGKHISQRIHELTWSQCKGYYWFTMRDQFARELIAHYGDAIIRQSFDDKHPLTEINETSVQRYVERRIGTIDERIDRNPSMQGFYGPGNAKMFTRYIKRNWDTLQNSTGPYAISILQAIESTINSDSSIFVELHNLFLNNRWYHTFSDRALDPNDFRRKLYECVYSPKSFIYILSFHHHVLADALEDFGDRMYLGLFINQEALTDLIVATGGNLRSDRVVQSATLVIRNYCFSNIPANKHEATTKALMHYIAINYGIMKNTNNFYKYLGELLRKMRWNISAELVRSILEHDTDATPDEINNIITLLPIYTYAPSQGPAVPQPRYMHVQLYNFHKLAGLIAIEKFTFKIDIKLINTFYHYYPTIINFESETVVRETLELFIEKANPRNTLPENFASMLVPALKVIASNQASDD